MKKKRLFLFWFILPSLTFYLIFMLIPVISTFYYGFFEGDRIIPTEFVGFTNYIKLFTQYPYIDRFLNAFKNNVIFYLLVTFFQNIGGLIIALIVTRKFKGAKFFRRITYIPVTLSILLAGFIFKLIINDLNIFNRALEFLHLDFVKVYLLDNASTALPVATLISVWYFIGITILLYSAGIDSIPDELIEAAKIDGTNQFGLIRYIKLPLLIPVMKMIFILNFIGNFSQNFEVIFATQGIQAGPFYSTDVFGTIFYRAAFAPPHAGGWGSGMGSVIGSIVFVIVGIGILIFFTIFNRLERNLE